MSINEHVTNPSVIEENSREIKMNSNTNNNDISMNVINENIYANNNNSKYRNNKNEYYKNLLILFKFNNIQIIFQLYKADTTSNNPDNLFNGKYIYQKVTINIKQK